jgi:hypothetical protein
MAVLGVVGPEKRFNQANQAEQAKLGKLGTVNFPTSCSQPAQSGDMKGAAKAYAQFSQQWRQADAQTPELREARDYLKKAAAR